MRLSPSLLLCISCFCALVYSRKPSPEELEAAALTYFTEAQQPQFPLNPFVSKVDITFSPMPDSNARAKKSIAELMMDDVAAAGIEEFNLELECDRTEKTCKTGDALDDFIKLIDRGSDYLRLLKRITWGHERSVLPPLLKSLEKHFPNLDLDVKVVFGDLNSLRSSSLLRSLYLAIAPHALATAKTSPLLTHVQTQIMGSKNLTKLSIKFASMGCVLYTVDPKFSKPKGKKFPPLEDLSLEAFPLSATNVDYWMMAMDWSRLRSLELRATWRPEYFLNAALNSTEGLPGLETIRIQLPHPHYSDTRADGEAFESAFLRFLSVPRTNGLSTVEMEGEHRPYLSTVLEIQGETLRSLHLHSPERSDDPQREMLSVPELRAIGLQAPNLEDIAVDINKLNGSLPEEFIDTLLSESSFPSLRVVELHGLLGVSNYTWRWGGHDRELTDQMPLISKLASRATIDRITIHVGEANRRLGGGLPASWVLWEYGNWELWEAERDSFGEMVVFVKKGWGPSRRFPS